MSVYPNSKINTGIFKSDEDIRKEREAAEAKMKSTQVVVSGPYKMNMNEGEATESGTIDPIELLKKPLTRTEATGKYVVSDNMKVREKQLECDKIVHQYFNDDCDNCIQNLGGRDINVCLAGDAPCPKIVRQADKCRTEFPEMFNHIIDEVKCELGEGACTGENAEQFASNANSKEDFCPPEPFTSKTEIRESDYGSGTTNEYIADSSYFDDDTDVKKLLSGAMKDYAACAYCVTDNGMSEKNCPCIKKYGNATMDGANRNVACEYGDAINSCDLTPEEINDFGYGQFDNKKIYDKNLLFNSNSSKDTNYEGMENLTTQPPVFKRRCSIPTVNRSTINARRYARGPPPRCTRVCKTFCHPQYPGRRFYEGADGTVKEVGGDCGGLPPEYQDNCRKNREAQFWGNNVMSLVDPKFIMEIIPTKDMSPERQNNAVIRLFAIGIAAFAVLTLNPTAVLIFIPVLIISLIVHAYNKREHFAPGPGNYLVNPDECLEPCPRYCPPGYPDMKDQPVTIPFSKAGLDLMEQHRGAYGTEDEKKNVEHITDMGGDGEYVEHMTGGPPVIPVLPVDQIFNTTPNEIPLETPMTTSVGPENKIVSLSDGDMANAPYSENEYNHMNSSGTGIMDRTYDIGKDLYSNDRDYDSMFLYENPIQ